MSTVTAILEASADGTLHLPVPEEMRRGKIKVAATLHAVEESPRTEEQRKSEMQAILVQIRARNPFRSIQDPVAWQRAMREDVALPGRE